MPVSVTITGFPTAAARMSACSEKIDFRVNASLTDGSSQYIP